MYTINDNDHSLISCLHENYIIQQDVVNNFPDFSIYFEELVLDWALHKDAIVANPTKDLHRDWTPYNTRYGYGPSISGMIAEKIAALNLSVWYGWPIRRALTYEDQCDRTIDLFFNNSQQEQTVQVKAVIFNKDALMFKPPGYQHITSDYISLIDISRCFHLLIPTSPLIDHLNRKSYVRLENLKELSTHFIDNKDLYTPTNPLRY
ncbi:hypothetical protein M0R04_14990 [Candidatus Dojkabacteria bacterium]|nr:hypothetical protein [Candidatus Dojkabacteria bacterium]